MTIVVGHDMLFLLNAFLYNIFFKLFIRNYGAILCDFINDDQEMETTVTNLTVQIFTVKSIAHILIEEENAFFFIMTFFRNQMEEHVDASKFSSKILPAVYN